MHIRLDYFLLNIAHVCFLLKISLLRIIKRWLLYIFHLIFIYFFPSLASLITNFSFSLLLRINTFYNTVIHLKRKRWFCWYLDVLCCYMTLLTRLINLWFNLIITKQIMFKAEPVYTHQWIWLVIRLIKISAICVTH